MKTQIQKIVVNLMWAKLILLLDLKIIFHSIAKDNNF